MADFVAQQLPSDDLQDEAASDSLVGQQLPSDVLLAQATQEPQAAQDFLVESVSPIDLFTMRAFNTTLVAHVYWENPITPDTTGVHSGYPPVQLTDILIYTRRIQT